MILDNRYSHKYYTIIEKAKKRTDLEGYSEKHHILPKSLGGTNDEVNLVKLTAREHFICHLLLIRMVEGLAKAKMVYAAWQLSRPTKNKVLNVTNRVYERLKKELSEAYTGKKRDPFSDQARKNMSEAHKGSKNYMYGKQHSEEVKEVMSQNRKGLTSGKSNPFYGKTHSPETIALIAKKSSDKQKGISKPKIACQYCGMLCAANTMKMFHGEACKSKPQPDKVYPSDQS